MRSLKPGYGIIHRSVMRDRSLSVNAKALYALLSSYQGQGVQCWPHLETMGEDLGMSVSTVQRAMTELVRAELVVKVKRFDDFRRDNAYVVQYPELGPEDVQEAQAVMEDQSKEPPVTSQAVTPDQLDAPPVTASMKNNSQESNNGKKNTGKDKAAAPPPASTLGYPKPTRQVTDMYQEYYVAEFGVAPEWGPKNAREIPKDIRRLGLERLKRTIQLWWDDPPDSVRWNIKNQGREYWVFHRCLGKMDEAMADEMALRRR